jgi:hypothetical protein
MATLTFTAAALATPGVVTATKATCVAFTSRRVASFVRARSSNLSAHAVVTMVALMVGVRPGSSLLSGDHTDSAHVVLLVITALTVLATAITGVTRASRTRSTP